MAAQPELEDADRSAEAEQALTNGVNPYAPPAPAPAPAVAPADGDAELPKARVFTTGAVGVATFLGSALAGTILMYLSLSRLGRPREAGRAALYGGGLTLATLAAAVLLPQGIGDGVPVGNLIPFAATLAVVMLSRQMLDPLVVPHLARGGRRGSGLLVAGVTIGSAMALLGALLGITQGLGVTGDDYVEASAGHRVIYERGASEGEARQVASMLEDNGVFPPGEPAEVVLRRKSSGLEMQVVLASGWKDEPVVTYYTQLARRLETRTGRSPFAILLCNDFLITKQKVSSTDPQPL